MRKNASNIVSMLFVLLISCSSKAQEITLIKKQTSNYSIVIPAKPTALETKSANVLQKYIKEVTNVTLPVVTGENPSTGNAIFMGHTKTGDTRHPEKLPTESYLLQTDGKNLIMMGGSGKGLIYGVYAFLETYLGCHKIANCAVSYAPLNDVKITGDISILKSPEFEYRECYFPASNDAEFLEWHGLHKFEDLWGPRMWGHTFDKLVPAKTYYNQHPEYYALVKGKRQATQLCLSNPNVYSLVVETLKNAITKNPDALYWSISPNDDNGYCECEKCSAIDKQEGSPSGSLIAFVNKVAQKFPDQKFTTLAYGYTHKAPASLKPASNVYVFLSDIDAYRDRPLETEPSAATFRNDLKAWGKITKNLFVWDYATQFTNYLAPFPDWQTYQANIKFFKNSGVKGLFIQGSGDTYCDEAEWKAYLFATLLKNDKTDVKKLMSDFINQYYGNAAGKFIAEYMTILQQKAIEFHDRMDIYGNPVNHWKGFLSPDNIDKYSEILDKAEIGAESKPEYTERLARLRLSLEYTVFQQARFFGIEKYGIFLKGANGQWSVKPKLEEKINRFVEACKKNNVQELAEAAQTPDSYFEEWKQIFSAGVTPTKALDGKVTLQFPFAEDYPAKGTKTLIDGNPGYTDFSYNWLCFYGNDMVATLELPKAISVAKISMNFLDDPRHWIFLPEKVIVETSTDGKTYKEVGAQINSNDEEHYQAKPKNFSFKAPGSQVKYLRITAKNLNKLPEWRLRDGKKPMIACDEIFVD